MIRLLRGGDELSRRRRLQALKDEADGGTGMLVTNLVQIEGKDAKVEDILGPAMTPPFLAPKRLVIVERFLDRWDGTNVSEEGESAPRRAPRGLGAFDPLITALGAGIPETTELVFTGGPVVKANPMVAQLKGISGVVEEVHEEPRREDLLRFIRDEAGARGVRFRASRATDEHWDSEDWVQRRESDPLALLAAITQGNTLAISNELDKLALYTMGRDVTVDDIYDLCSGDRDVTVFNLLDAIQDGKTGDAVHHLRRLTEREEVGQMLISMLSTRFRQTAVVAELIESGAGEEEVGRAMGNAGRYPGLRQAGMRRARRVGVQRCLDALAMIVDYDYRAKKNEIHHEVALELLVTKLSELANGRMDWSRAPFLVR